MLLDHCDMPYADILHMSTESDRPKENYKHGTFAVHNVDAVVTQETCQRFEGPSPFYQNLTISLHFHCLISWLWQLRQWYDMAWFLIDLEKSTPVTGKSSGV